MTEDRRRPQFPIYIVSKGRADSRLTAKALDRLGVPYHIVIEEPERDDYAAVIDPAMLLVLDPAYQRRYDTYDDVGEVKSTGPGPARNFAWDHAIAQGAAWHWVMDDNIRDFFRFNRNRKIRVADGTIFRVMEDFCLRYRNVAMAGPNYDFFVPQRNRKPVYTPNTRIYSCNLIRNDVPFRWRGRYNEDTDLSLRMLKHGWCTILFNCFLQNKVWTQTLRGGNTAEFYAAEGTMPKSQMQVAMHPDVSRVIWRFGRWHHLVDYRPFRANRFILRDGVMVPRGIDDYGMVLRPYGGAANGG
jgi:hypothetical protein